MIEIYSPSNSKIGFVKNLADKKFRDETRLFFVEGYRSVTDMLKVVHSSKVHSIYVTEKYSKNQELNAFNEKLILTNDICMQKMSDTKTSQGIIAVLEQPEFAKELSDYNILLDGLTDGGNIGTVIRTSAAAGYGVILKDCADIFSPKVVRSSMSAIVKTRMYKYTPELIRELKSRGTCFYAGDMDGADIFGLSREANRVCIAVGNEAEGLSNEILGICDRKVSIPMQNMESLNVAVSAAILMYNIKFR